MERAHRDERSAGAGHRAALWLATRPSRVRLASRVGLALLLLGILAFLAGAARGQARAAQRRTATFA